MDEPAPAVASEDHQKKEKRMPKLFLLQIPEGKIAVLVLLGRNAQLVKFLLDIVFRSSQSNFILFPVNQYCFALYKVKVTFSDFL